MRFASVATFLFALLIAFGGSLIFRQTGSLFFPSLGMISSLVLLAGAIGLWRRSLVAGFVTCGTSMLLGLFFGYQFISSEALIPGGILLVTSFITLFIVLVAVFVTLQK